MLGEFWSYASLALCERLWCNEDIQVRPSRIQQGGLGLFTNRRFEQGEVMCVYFGAEFSTVAALRRANKDYLMRLGEQTYIDALAYPLCLARYINDCRNTLGYNVHFEKMASEGVALVRTTRGIDRGFEVYADYGKWYWQSAAGGERLSLSALVMERLEREAVQIDLI